MRKLMSLAMALVMVCSMSVSAFAAGEQTTVIYDADAESGATEQYTVTVPATLAPGQSGDVTAEGTWASNRVLTVTAPASVTMTNDIDGGTKDLAVTFPGIDKVGSNTVAVSDTQSLSVADMTDALFGTWTGTIVYTVSMADAT